MGNDENDSVEAVAARLAKVRLALGLEKKDFAERAGLQQQVYGPFENGKRPITIDAAKKLRKAYGLSLEFIYFGKMDDLPHRIATLL